MTLQESTLNTGTEVHPAVRKRWFGYRGRKVRGYSFAVDEDEVARNVGIPRGELEIEPAEWDGRSFVVKRDRDNGA